tara:strand:- start:59 stop:271 length:213 start_codon:yes stop_codon:yes gene_type:complete
MSKFNDLLEAEGISESEFLESFAFDSIVPGICMSKGCNYTANYEPDQDRGWCEECEEASVKSGLVIMGWI